jgi:hypothetical protein
LDKFSVLFRNGKLWDCNLTRVLNTDHNWRHLVVENIKFWKKRYSQLMKEELLTTEQFGEIKFTDLKFKI